MHSELSRLKYRFAVPLPAPLLEQDGLELLCNRTGMPRTERELAVLLLRAELGDLDLLELADLRGGAL